MTLVLELHDASRRADDVTAEDATAIRLLLGHENLGVHAAARWHAACDRIDGALEQS